MKAKHRARVQAFLALATIFCTSISTREVAAQKDAAIPESHNHDSAFSILLETYRQFQNNLIQVDYQNRLLAGASLSDSGTRKEVMALAKQERDLRLKKLAIQLAVFSVTYDHARQGDEPDVAATGKSGVDTKAAAEELRNFVVIAPDETNTIRTLPSSSVLLNKSPKP
jgi:hypothetical protein